jgi:nitroreductase
LIDNPTLEAIRHRRSVRNFVSAPVTDEELEAILEAGRWAPSALNSQPWDFVVVRDPQLRTAIGNTLRRITYAWRGFAGAPAMIVVSVDRTRDPEHFVEDGAIAAQNICLAAQSLGLASAWAGVFARRFRRSSVEHELRTLLSLPRTHRVVAVVPIGVAKHEHESSRRPLAEMVHHDRFRPVPPSRSQATSMAAPDAVDQSRDLPRVPWRRSRSGSGRLT